jgi:hypothetical protein
MPQSVVAGKRIGVCRNKFPESIAEIKTQDLP